MFAKYPIIGNVIAGADGMPGFKRPMCQRACTTIAAVVGLFFFITGIMAYANVANQINSLNIVKDGNEETKYVYDTLNRLKLATNTSPEFFDFDPAGNLLSIANSPTSTPGLVKGNRLLIQGDKKFEYDARGNLIQETRGKEGKLKKTFHYNLQNQLVKVETNAQHETVTYKYDPLGRRIQKTDKFGTTTFLWTDNLLAQETRNKIKKTYLFEPGSFRPLAQVQDDQVFHYHLDHLGTPRELTNDEGKIVWKAKYKTYGNLAVKEVEEVENNLRFQGQYFDEETGLHYNRFRYYSPDTGQFINQDPIGLLGGLNNYQYAPNPIAWIDPLGLCKENEKNSDIKVLGRIEDTTVARDWAGHDVLNIPGWTIKKNDQWVEQGIKNKQEFYTASPEKGNLWDAAANRETVYARELKQIKEAGYIMRGDSYFHPKNI
jgi:RHS repeat-associated protein